MPGICQIIKTAFVISAMPLRFLFAGLLFFLSTGLFSQSNFVSVKNKQFFIGNSPYSFFGVNMWYAGLLATHKDGKQRLIRELDFLKHQGVTNIRVLARAEGMGIINGRYRVEPALQPGKYSINNNLLHAFDFLLAELGKRNMKAVIYLSNNWEWSGGFLQYLNWSGQLSDTDMRSNMEWEKMRNVISEFYSCGGCKEMYFDAVAHFINRKNSITGIPYFSDASIMAWEIANEPRPMRPAAIPFFTQFIHDAAGLIKSIDKNHLVTTGSEGVIGSENAATFISVHADSLIDYATMHIWPKNWQWFSDTSIQTAMPEIKAKTYAYLAQHDSIMQKLNKPIVLEEFGMPRDGEKISVTSTYKHRTDYFHFIAETIFLKPAFKSICGINFWAMGGEVLPKPLQPYWQPGDPLMGDPPFEPQGLNAVFDTDTHIWKLVKSINEKLEKGDE